MPDFSQIFVADKMSVVAHLVGLEQIGYEKELGLNLSVSSTFFLIWASSFSLSWYLDTIICLSIYFLQYLLANS